MLLSMMRWCTRTIGLVALLAAIAGPSDASRSISGAPPGEIVFSRSASQKARPKVYLMSADGSRLRSLAQNASDPAVTPDGREIAFVRAAEIWVMRRDGSGQRKVTRPDPRVVGDTAPSWSPDGTTLYFSRYVSRTEVSSIYSVAPNGRHPHQLTHPVPTSHGHCQDEPAASPNGKIIVFTETFDCEHGSDRRLEAITAGGRHVGLPFQFPSDSMIYDAAWSPDGQTIAYATEPLDSGGASGLFLSALSGRSNWRVARPGAAPNFVSAPAWSRDGERIAFIRNVAQPEGYPGDIWIVRRDGSEPTHLTQGTADDQGPAWLPPA